MSRTRFFLSLLPLAALGLSGWAGWRVNQESETPKGTLTLQLPGPLPVLNPLSSANEAERQLLDLLHEPLIRLDRAGRLSPALAEEWTWHQVVTCWYASEVGVKEAQQLLAGLSAETRMAWELEEVTVQGNALILRFSRPGTPGPNEALQMLSETQPLPLTFIRVPQSVTARPALEAFARDPAHALSTQRLWFDDDGTCEIVTTRTSFQAQQALADWLRTRVFPLPQIQRLDEVTGLAEPVLDLSLSEKRALWADQTPITAEDVRATVTEVMEKRWPVPGREGLRHIQSIQTQGKNGLRITYRRTYGPALASWVGLPILPASWLKEHRLGGSDLPPGAGDWQVQSRSATSLTLIPSASAPQEPARPRLLRFIPAATALRTRVGLASGKLDFIWPDLENAEVLRQESLNQVTTPSRNRLLILWNTKSPHLNDANVRQALGQAVDRKELLSGVLEGRGRLAEGLFPPDLWLTPPRTPLKFDLTAATERLASVGWLKDVSGLAKKGTQTLEFEILFTAGNAQRQQLAEALAWQWAQVGARVTITAVPASDLVSQRLAPGRFDAVLLGLNDELSWDHSAFWHSREMGRGLNFAQVADPQLDLLLEALAGEFDPLQVPARAQAVEERLMALHPMLSLFGDQQTLGLSMRSFPQLPVTSTTLRDLLNPHGSPAAFNLQMRAPDE